MKIDTWNCLSKLLFVFMLLLLNQRVLGAQADSNAAIEFFETKIRPLLATNCYECHGSQLQQGNLRLDSRESILKGGTRGSAISLEKPQSSWLVKAVQYKGLQMPPSGPLSPEQAKDIEQWVAMGIPWPEHSVSEQGSKGVNQLYQNMVKEHWAFQPVAKVQTPEFGINDVVHPVDQYIWSSLNKIGLKPNQVAARQIIARRLSFVLLGMPPEAEVVDEFVQDESPEAYEKLVSRFLASPHFGEHWARHWMDLMRFAETYGFEWNYEIPSAWRYRDYLIRAFNQDLPFNKLIREHIAGDLLEKPRIDRDRGVNESIIGAAFFRLGEMGHDNCVTFREMRTDVVDNQIDTLTKAFQGLTVACARCHDHKIDPIPTKDYYALYGILNSSRQVSRTLDTGELHQKPKEILLKTKDLIRKEIASQWISQSKDISRYLLSAQAMQDGQYNRQKKPFVNLDQSTLKHWIKVLRKESTDSEGLLFPWAVIACETNPSSDQVRGAWIKLGTHYEGEMDSRFQFNQKNFLDFADFRSNSLNGWHSDGLGIEGGSTRGGDLTIHAVGDQIVKSVLPSGIFTHRISDRLNGALRSPYLPKDKKFISFEIMGGKLAARRMIIDHCIIGDHYKLLNSDRFSWVKMPIKANKEPFPVYVELVTRYGNPRLPERPEFGDKPDPELLSKVGSYFGVSRVVLHDVNETPRQDLAHMDRLFNGPPLNTRKELAERYQSICHQALVAWSEGRATDQDVRWIDWLVRNNLLKNFRKVTTQLDELVQIYRDTESKLSDPKLISSMADLDPGFDVSLLEKGDAKRPGDQVPRGYLSYLNNSPQKIKSSGSGRRELAEIIASDRNPLTARVMVNRLWYHVFGSGIVETVDNFGRFGGEPSHPELLDYLSNRFISDGWSIKKLLRFLVLSATFQQSNQTSVKAIKLDPKNRMLHHYPLRRLRAEAIRDSILATSGRLQANFFGPSIQPFRKNPNDYRKLLSGPLDGEGRRSLYLKVTRMEGPQFLELFDFPLPSVTRGRRDTTNVASQALALLNDDFVIGQAEFWADRLLEFPNQTVEQRVEKMFRTALGRSPKDSELVRFKYLVVQLGNLHGITQEDLLKSREVWKDLAHSIFNLKEMIYIQ